MTNSHKSSRPKGYFKVHYLLLRFLGLGWWHHPQEENFNNFPGYYLYYTVLTEFIWVFCFVGMETLDPFVGEQDLDRFMFNLSFVITHNLTVIKLYLFFAKNKEIQDVAHTLEVKVHDYYQNYAKNRSTIRTTRILTSTFLFFGWMAVGSSMVYGGFKDFSWRKEVKRLNETDPIPFRTLPQNIYIPWDYQDDITYIPTFFIETLGLLWTGHIVMTIDTLVGSIILHMANQFSTLQEAIVSVYDRTMEQLNAHVVNELEQSTGTVEDLEDRRDRIERQIRLKYSEEEIDEALRQTFKQCVDQHQLLVSCVEKFNAAYSYGFLSQLASSTGAICVVMVQVAQDASSLTSAKLVTSMSFFLAMTTQLAIQCFAGNDITIEAEGVGNAVMDSKWEKTSPRMRRTLLLVMIRAQRPIRLNAGGFAYVNNGCFLSIMKAAYSYYAVLSQKQK